MGILISITPHRWLCVSHGLYSSVALQHHHLDWYGTCREDTATYRNVIFCFLRTTLLCCLSKQEKQISDLRKAPSFADVMRLKNFLDVPQKRPFVISGTC